jgi:Predicted nucleic acid-binding protein, contains PIN domain
MIVADTSPLNYLVLINQIDLLPRLYGRFLIPESVHTELTAMETPQLVRTWVANLPEWIEVSTAIRHDDQSLSRLHRGERDTISLALEVGAPAVLMDERHGRQEAEKRGLNVIGTLGVLIAAHELDLIDLIAALDSLRQTSFHVSPKLLASIAVKYQDKQ